MMHNRTQITSLGTQSIKPASFAAERNRFPKGNREVNKRKQNAKNTNKMGYGAAVYGLYGLPHPSARRGHEMRNVFYGYGGGSNRFDRASRPYAMNFGQAIMGRRRQQWGIGGGGMQNIFHGGGRQARPYGGAYGEGAEYAGRGFANGMMRKTELRDRMG